MIARVSGWLGAIALLLASGCGDAWTAAGTGVFVQVELPAAIAVDQLRVTVDADNGATFGPVLKPDPAAADLSGTQTLRLQLDDSLDGVLVRVTVLGLHQGKTVGTATGAAELHRGRESDVVLMLK